MNGVEILKLAADFAAGGITSSAIKDSYGEGVLSTVLSLTGGVVAGAVTNAALNIIEEETGIIGDLGSVVDDIFSIF